MTDGCGNTQGIAADLPSAVRGALDQVFELARLAHIEGVDPSELGPEALYWLAQIFPPPSASGLSGRPAWLVVLDWLERSMAFAEVGELRDVLDDLDRGIVGDELRKPKGAGQGRRASKSNAKMLLLQKAVEAANEIGRRFAPTERDDQIENGAGVPLETLRRWRGMLDAGPSRFRPATTWFTSYGEQEPVAVLRAAAAEYRRTP